MAEAHKCPHCNAPLEKFYVAPGDRYPHCVYCGTEVPVPDLQVPKTNEPNVKFYTLSGVNVSQLNFEQLPPQAQQVLGQMGLYQPPPSFGYGMAQPPVVFSPPPLYSPPPMPLSAPNFRVGRFIWILVLTTVLPIVATVVPLAMVFMTPTCGNSMGYVPAAMDRLNACPAAVEALGAPVEVGGFGMHCGNSEFSGSTGYADWSMPVVGSTTSGRYDFYISSSGGSWNMSRGTVTVDGRTIDIMTCPSTTAPGQAMPGISGMPVVPGVPGMPVAPTSSSGPLSSPGAEMLRQRCDGGDASSCTGLGMMFRNGSAGVTQDPNMARQYLQRACQLGNQGACFLANQ